MFDDARFSTRTRARSGSTTGVWLSVVLHATIAAVLIGVVPTRASEKLSTPRTRSIGVFSVPSEPAPVRTAGTMPVTAPRLPSRPGPAPAVHEVAIAEARTPVVDTPIAAKPVEPVSAPLPPATASAFQRPPETGVFERASGSRTNPSVAAITTGEFGSVQPSPRGTADRVGDVRTAGFDRRASALVPSTVPRPIDRPVEIVFKPSPEYTDDARSARIEGTVTLDLDFTAAGDVHVVRVVRGLGHGLDEAAERAAVRIRFKPSQSDGRAVDFRATVHITFRLS